MKEKTSSVPQAPDWSLAPMEKAQETSEAQETKLELEPMTQEEAAEKYSIKEESPTESSAEQVEALSAHREQIVRMKSEVVKKTEEEFRQEAAARVQTKKEKDFLSKLDKDHFFDDRKDRGHFEADFNARMYHLRETQKADRKTATKIGGLLAVSLGASAFLAGGAAAGAGAFLMAVPFVPVGAAVGWGGAKLYQWIKNRRLEKSAAAIVKAGKRR